MGLRRGALACTIARACACSWRAMKHAVMLTEYMRTMYSQPDIEKARKHADTFLPKDRHGRLYPLSTPLKSFHSLGAGVALYMHMVHWWSLFFFAATLVSFSSLVLNMEGDGLDVTERNMYTIHSLGNAAHHRAGRRDRAPLPTPANLAGSQILWDVNDFSPEWDGESGGAKVIISGHPRPGTPEGLYLCCVFGQTEVPAEQIAPGVLRCRAPPHPPGRVPFYISCLGGGKRPASDIGTFEFRDATSRHPSAKDRRAAEVRRLLRSDGVDVFARTAAGEEDGGPRTAVEVAASAAPENEKRSVAPDRSTTEPARAGKQPRGETRRAP